MPTRVASLYVHPLNLEFPEYFVSPRVRLDHHYQMQISRSLKLEALNGFHRHSGTLSQPKQLKSTNRILRSRVKPILDARTAR